MDLKQLIRLQWDRIGASALVVLGAIVLLLGWIGVSDAVYPAEQLPYIVSGGLGGLALVGLGAMLWVSADIRDEWSELHEIARLLAASGSKSPETALADQPDVQVSSVDVRKGRVTRNRRAP